MTQNGWNRRLWIYLSTLCVVVKTIYWITFVLETYATPFLCIGTNSKDRNTEMQANSTVGILPSQERGRQKSPRCLYRVRSHSFHKLDVRGRSTVFQLSCIGECHYPTRPKISSLQDELIQAWDFKHFILFECFCYSFVSGPKTFHYLPPVLFCKCTILPCHYSAIELSYHAFACGGVTNLIVYLRCLFVATWPLQICYLLSENVSTPSSY